MTPAQRRKLDRLKKRSAAQPPPGKGNPGEMWPASKYPTATPQQIERLKAEPAVEWKNGVGFDRGRLAADIRALAGMISTSGSIDPPIANLANRRLRDVCDLRTVFYEVGNLAANTTTGRPRRDLTDDEVTLDAHAQTARKLLLSICSAGPAPDKIAERLMAVADGICSPVKALPENWLVPTSLADLANRLNNTTTDNAKAILRPYGLKMVGNRQKWTVRLDGMPSNIRTMIDQR